MGLKKILIHLTADECIFIWLEIVNNELLLHKTNTFSGGLKHDFLVESTKKKYLKLFREKMLKQIRIISNRNAEFFKDVFNDMHEPVGKRKKEKKRNGTQSKKFKNC